MTYKYLKLDLEVLLLDEDNPRLGEVQTQSEALEALIQLDETHFQNLMASIKDNGLDPGDSLYVIKSENDYVVLEGNRRTSAMMVLNSPSRLEPLSISVSAKRKLSAVAQDFDLTQIEPIRCVQFVSREAAHDWILRRHTGAAKGEGRIDWGPLEIDRFTDDRSITDILKFVGENADYTDEEWVKTKTVIESKKSSTLSRLLTSAPGRKHLRITIKEGPDGEKIPYLNTKPTWALKVLKRIIDDVSRDLVNSRTLNRASDIENYFSNLPKDLQPLALGSKSTPQPIADLTVKKNAAPVTANAPTTTKKKASTPKLRTTLAPKRHEFKPPEQTRGQRLLIEASKLDANKFAISSAFVLRSFVEYAVFIYMTEKKVPNTKMVKGEEKKLNLAQRCSAVATHMVQNKECSTSDVTIFRNGVVNNKSVTSIQSLNNFVHNAYSIPTGDSLRVAWDSCVPVFVAAFGKV